MALGIVVATRNTMLAAINTAADVGAGVALLRIYDGVRPATGGAATVLLAEISCSKPFGVIAAGVLTVDNTPALTDASANATGTATWFRLVDSAGVVVFDGSVGTSGSDLNLVTTAIVITQPVTINTGTITAGNP